MIETEHIQIQAPRLTGRLDECLGRDRKTMMPLAVFAVVIRRKDRLDPAEAVTIQPDQKAATLIGKGPLAVFANLAFVVRVKGEFKN